jgi:hypothetical protein
VLHQQRQVLNLHPRLQASRLAIPLLYHQLSLP